MKKFFILPVVLCISYSLTFAQIGTSTNKSGTTAAQFLKIGVGSRAIGMGGAFTTMYGDVTSLYWNPAGIGKIYSQEAAFHHTDWILDVNYDYAGYALHIPDLGTIGASVSVLTMNDDIVRTIEKPEGTGEFFSAGALSIGLSYARNLTENFSIGFTAKYLREHIWNESAVGFAFDIGTLYTIDIGRELRFGASISNFGPKMKMQGRDLLYIVTTGSGTGNLINSDVQLDEYELPLLFRIGISSDLFKVGEHRISAAIDAIHPNDNTEAMNLGAEYGWNEMLFVRGGFKSLFEMNSEQGFTAGLGVNYRILDAFRLVLDYAYEDFGRLKDVQYLSVGIKF